MFWGVRVSPSFGLSCGLVVLIGSLGVVFRRRLARRGILSLCLSCAIVILALLMFGCERGVADIPDDQREYFNRVRGIVHTLGTCFENLKASTIRADVTNPARHD